jgi:hypothetical protein
MTVRCRRSAEDIGGAGTGGGGETVVSAVPQFAQNFACGGLP